MLSQEEKLLFFLMCIIAYSIVVGFIVNFILTAWMIKLNNSLPKDKQVNWDIDFLTIKVIFFPFFLPIVLIDKVMNIGGKIATKVVKKKDLSEHLIDEE